MLIPNRLVALAVTTAPTFLSWPIYPAKRSITGMAILIAEHDGARWTFDLRSYAPSRDQAAVDLLIWATSALPPTGTLLGWRLSDEVVRPLVDAAGRVPHAISAPFLIRLFNLAQSALCIDLADGPQSQGAVTLSAAAQQAGLAREMRLRSGRAPLFLAERRVALIWRLWLHAPGPDLARAQAAFTKWLAALLHARRRVRRG